MTSISHSVVAGQAETMTAAVLLRMTFEHLFLGECFVFLLIHLKKVTDHESLAFLLWMKYTYSTDSHIAISGASISKQP